MTALSTIEDLVDEMNNAHLMPHEGSSDAMQLKGYENYVRGMKIIFFSHICPTVMKKLRIAGVLTKIGENAIFLTLHEAVCEAKSLVEKIDKQFMLMFGKADTIDYKANGIEEMDSPTYGERD